jgi:hypothetical protein
MTTESDYQDYQERVASKERREKEDGEARAAYESLRPEFLQLLRETWDREGPGKSTEEKLEALVQEFQSKFERLRTNQSRWIISGGLTFRMEVDIFLKRNDPKKIAERRASLRGQYGNEGIVENIEDKVKKDGKPFQVLRINGKHYTRWNPNEGLKDIRIGQNVFFTGYEGERGLEVEDITLDPAGELVPGKYSRKQTDSPRPVEDNTSEPTPEPPLTAPPANPRALALSKSPKGKKSYSRSDKLDFAITNKGSLIMEKGSSLVTWLLGRTEPNLGTVELISGKLDYQVGWIKFVVASVIYRESSSMKPVEMENPTVVSFTDHDFRKILRKPRISSRDIRAVVDKFAGVVLKMTSLPILLNVDDKGKKEWRTIDVSGPLGIIMTTTDQREGEEERRQYCIGFSTPAGKVFVNNIRKRGFILLSPDTFLRLSPGAQNLFWTLGWHEDRIIFHLEGAAELLRWDEVTTTGQRYDLKKKLEASLDELKEARYISTWTKAKVRKDGKMTWAYQVNKSKAPTKSLAVRNPIP